MKFLGTGAAEGTPNPFCSCRVCQNARAVGGAEIRTRSSFLLTERTVIDLGADFFAQSSLCGVPFDRLENVFFTHTHDDHLNYTFIWERFVAEKKPDKKLSVYMTSGAADNFLNKFYLSSPLTEGAQSFLEEIDIVRLEFGKTYEADGFRVTPLKGNHGTSMEENAANYLFEKGSRSMYYALDSGYFLEDTLKSLENAHLDIFVGECTFTNPEAPPVKMQDWHMDLAMCLKNLDRLFDIGAIDGHTRVYLSHIGSGGLTHKELCSALKNADRPYEATVAFDGLTIDDL